MLKEKNQEKHDRRFKGCEENGSEKNYILKKKSLNTALDSFNNLFCRLSLVLNLKLILVLHYLLKLLI